LNDFENIFGTGPDQSQVGANLETMNIAAATIGDLTVTGTITMDGIELGTETLVAPAISTGYFRIVSPLAANIPLVFSPQGTGGVIVGPTPDGTAVGGNARGAYSVDMQFARTAATQVASGTGSFMVATQQLLVLISVLFLPREHQIFLLAPIVQLLDQVETHLLAVLRHLL
jgi:hypothetical protein